MNLKYRLINLSFFLAPTLLFLLVWINTSWTATDARNHTALFLVSCVSMCGLIIGSAFSIASALTGRGPIWRKIRRGEWLAKSSNGSDIRISYSKSVWLHRNDPMFKEMKIYTSEATEVRFMGSARFIRERSTYW